MKKLQRLYDQELPADADYKMEWLYNRDKENFESTDKWIYLGADAQNPTFAKVGISAVTWWRNSWDWQWTT